MHTHHPEQKLLQSCLIVLLLLTLPLTATQAREVLPATAPAQPVQVGLVPDVAGIGDMSFNWLAYQGLLRAESELGVIGTVYTSTDPGDFEPNLQQCVNDGNDLCIAVGFLLYDATWNVAQANPGTNFAIVDVEYGDYLPNLRGIVFAEEECAYLAGTLAGLMTDSDILGEIGGIPIPPVDRFLHGFRNGAQCANLTATAIISYTYDFANPDLGAQYAQGLLAQGADTIFVAAGGTGSGAVLTATQSGAWGIGVDVDYYLTVFQSGTVAGSDRLLTSALKRIDNTVFMTIEDEVDSQFTSGTVRYNLAMDGVGIAPFHETDPLIPQAVKDQLEVVQQGIISGTVDPWYTCRVFNRYVDAATGSDDSDCSNPDTPCQTIGYAVDQAGDSDPILVAQGTYTENITLNKRIFLQGGYSGPPDWTRDLALYPTTIRSGSATVPGDWDGHGVGAPVIVSMTGELAMWYGGRDMYGQERIGQATSLDGITWAKSSANPLLDGSEHFVVVNGPADYTMWYSQHESIYRATSGDGLTWTTVPTLPVFTPTREEGSWERDGVWDPSIVQDGGGTYWMFYEALHGDWNLAQIGVATSTDGIAWTRVQTDPVLSPGAPGAWDERWVLDPMVLYEGGAFRMWYAGIDADWTRRVGYAASPDGINWTKDDAHNPVFTGDPGQWDDGSVIAPFILHDGGYQMWYHANGAIGYVTSTEGLTWTRSLTGPVLWGDAPGQWGAPVVAFEPGSDGAILDGFTITGADVGYDGAISIYGTAPIIQACVIQGNTAAGPDEWGAGGVLIGNGAAPVISQTLIVNNSVAGGGSGIRISGASLTLVNSLIAGNTGRPAIHASNATLVLTNVTIADNSNVGVLLNDAQATVLNSLIWEVEGGDIVTGNNGLYTVDYSNLEDGVVTGTGNISAEPLFLGGGDYHLQDGSPCIDVGTTAGAPAHDWEGDMRPFGYEVDMGADEWLGELGAGLLAMAPGGSGAPGAAAVYTLTVTNEGNYTDTFQLSAGGVWTPTLSTDTAGPLAPGEVFTFTLDVAIPAGAAGGSTDMTTVTATSGWDASIWATAQVTTTAVGGEYRVYLPVVLRAGGR